MLFAALTQVQTDLTESNGWAHRRHTALAKWQLGSDFLIAIAYFSIPLELVYFLIKSQVLPFRWVIALFGTFIVLCGITHLLTLWNYYVNSEAAHMGMTFAKVVTAAVSCFTAVILIWVIPVILDVKKREEFYTQKTAELDVEVGNIKKDQQVLKHVRMLTDEIRSSLDRHKILNTTMIELANTLDLESCNIWMPKPEGKVLELVHKLGVQDAFAPAEISLSTSLAELVFSNNGAVVVPSRSMGPLAGVVSGSHRSDTVVAIRIPLLRTDSQCKETPYALMVLALTKNLQQKTWTDHELELVEAVADQVAVALSHAAVVEETLRAQDLLIEQNLALQKAKKEAESAMLARNEFLVVMNHEMRTPMHAVIALSSLLMETSLTSDQRSMVETISKSASLLSTLINDVLDFSRLEAGSLSLDPQPFEVAKFLDDAERITSPLAQAKNLPYFSKRLGGLPNTVMGDSTRLLQVVLNVVGNAIKFTKEGHVCLTVFSSKAEGEIDLRSFEPRSPGRPLQSKYLHFEVVDTGIGIRPVDIPRLFNKFVQADSSTSRKFGGSGLGLAISKKLVELMGGTISIQSEGLGQGSTCRFCVCVAVVRETEPLAVLSPKEPDSYKHLKILAVDDNAVNRTVIRRLLNNLGCQSTIVDSGQNCLKQVAADGASTYNVVLVDLCMPEMDGYELTAELFKLYPDLCVVALTANTDDNTRSKCLEMGMRGVLTKPVSLNVLKRELKRSCKL